MSNFPLRLPKDSMRDAKTIAKDQVVSVNQCMATVLSERVGEVKAMTQLRNRASRGYAKAALSILEGAPDIAPFGGRWIDRT